MNSQEAFVDRNDTSFVYPYIERSSRVRRSTGDFFDDKDNLAMYIVAPCLFLVFCSCCGIYSVYKCRQYMKKNEPFKEIKSVIRNPFAKRPSKKDEFLKELIERGRPSSAHSVMMSACTSDDKMKYNRNSLPNLKIISEANAPGITSITEKSVSRISSPKYTTCSPISTNTESTTISCAVSNEEHPFEIKSISPKPPKHEPVTAATETAATENKSVEVFSVQRSSQPDKTLKSSTPYDVIANYGNAKTGRGKPVAFRAQRAGTAVLTRSYTKSSISKHEADILEKGRDINTTMISESVNRKEQRSQNSLHPSERSLSVNGNNSNSKNSSPNSLIGLMSQSSDLSISGRSSESKDEIKGRPQLNAYSPLPQTVKAQNKDCEFEILDQSGKSNLAGNNERNVYSEEPPSYSSLDYVQNRQRTKPIWLEEKHSNAKTQEHDNRAYENSLDHESDIYDSSKPNDIRLDRLSLDKNSNYKEIKRKPANEMTVQDKLQMKVLEGIEKAKARRQNKRPNRDSRIIDKWKSA